MLIRALIVLLLVLNLGVALWWAMRPAPAAPGVEALPAGVARLQLVSEQQGEPAPAPPFEMAVERCLRFGPFADAAAAGAARADLRPLAVQVRPYRDFAGTARSWKVLLPTAGVEAAEAAAERIAAAGFRDWLVIREGEDAGSVALGLYRNQAAARERVQALQDAGFAAELEPVGAGPARHWVDVAVPAGFDADAAQERIAAAGHAPLDCEGLEPAA
jgi:hypothetical protein